MEIAPLSEKYLLEVLAIEKASFPKPWTKQMFERELSLPISRFFVALADAEVLAYSGYWLVQDEAHILNFAVNPSHRKKGYAKKMLAYIMENAKNAGAVKMLLEVRKRNLPALELYRSQGFNIVGERPGYYGDDDAVLMDKAL